MTGGASVHTLTVNHHRQVSWSIYCDGHATGRGLYSNMQLIVVALVVLERVRHIVLVNLKTISISQVRPNQRLVEL